MDSHFEERLPRKGHGIPLDDLRVDAAGLPGSEFREKHGSAFLITQATTVPVRPSQQTVVADGPPQHNAVSFLVFPLRARPENPFPDFLSIGRTANNDIVLDDGSISKCHAFIRTTENRWVLEDANSRNGTWVGDEQCGTSGKGRLLSAGTRVSLGSIHLTFVTDKELVLLCMQLPDR